MDAVDDIRTGRHCVFSLNVHLVFVTKYRRQVLDAKALEILSQAFAKVCTDFEGELVRFSGEDDHVHLEVRYPPKVAVSRLVNSLKGVSSRVLRTKYPAIAKRYYNNVLWSPSYLATSSGEESGLAVRHYVKKQQGRVQQATI